MTACSQSAPGWPHLILFLLAPDSFKMVSSKHFASEPRIFKRAPLWSTREDALLLELRGQRLSWPEIQKSFPDRTWTAIKKRYYKLTEDPNRVKKAQKAWTKEEKKLLVELAESNIPWKEIAKSFPERNIPSLRDKYRYLIRGRSIPKTYKRRYTAEENELLIKLAEEGVPWEERVKFFDNRTLQALESQYTKIATSKSWPPVYTSEDDDSIIQSLKSGLPVEEIAELIGRKPLGVRRRIRKLEKLNRVEPAPQIAKYRRYTAAEIKLITKLVNKGVPWSEIASKHFPGRSSKNMKESYLMRQKRKKEREEKKMRDRKKEDN